jgi:hypothetical protein
MTVDDPALCRWCGRAMPDVVARGCGSREGTQEQVDRWCGVLETARRSARQDARFPAASIRSSRSVLRADPADEPK